jgi:hypothetical protein
MPQSAAVCTVTGVRCVQSNTAVAAATARELATKQNCAHPAATSNVHRCCYSTWGATADSFAFCCCCQTNSASPPGATGCSQSATCQLQPVTAPPPHVQEACSPVAAAAAAAGVVAAATPAAGASSCAGVACQQLYDTSIGVQLRTKPEQNTASGTEQAPMQIAVQFCRVEV